MPGSRQCASVEAHLDRRSRHGGLASKTALHGPTGNADVEREMIELAPTACRYILRAWVAEARWHTRQPPVARGEPARAHGRDVESIASVEPDVIVLAHTATSYVLGRDGDASCKARRRTASLRFGAGSAARLRDPGRAQSRCRTPYDQALTLRGKAVLEEYGFRSSR